MELFLHEDHIFEFMTNQATAKMSAPVVSKDDGSFNVQEGMYGEETNKKILLAKYSGDFVLDDYWWSRNVGSFVSHIRSIANEFDSYVFQVDTNGGHAAAAMEFDGMVQDLKSRGKVIIHTNYIHSAGIMATTNADRIIGNGQFSSFGSVGVYYELSKYMADLYKKYVVFAYSSKSPDKNKAFREFVKTGKANLYEKMATKSDEMFMKLVSDNRPISDKYNDSLAGGTFQGVDAKLRGFCDHIGTLNKAIEFAKK